MGRNEKLRAEKRRLQKLDRSRPCVNPKFRNIATNLEFQLDMRCKLLAEIRSRSDWHSLATVCIENHQAMLVEQLSSDNNKKEGVLFTAQNCSYDEIYKSLSDRDRASVKTMVSHPDVALLFVYQEFQFPVLCYGYSRNEILEAAIAA